MRYLFSVLIAGAAGSPLIAGDYDELLGIWGNERQCAGAVVKDGGTLRASPFEIREGWLIHGNVWCKLTNFPPQKRENGMFIATQALCGEDSHRSYRLDLMLGDTDSTPQLRLIWDEALINGPLQRCLANR